MCSAAGLVDLRFSTRAPYWCVVGVKAEGVAALASTVVLWLERRGLRLGRVLVFDLQGSITLLAGALIALITLFTSYGHVDIPGVGSIQLNQQAGVLLIIASLATLAGVDEVFSEGVVELATRRRLRAERDRIRSERDRVREAQDRARAEDEAARERNRAARRAQLQNRYALFQLQHQLDPTPDHTRQLRGLISFLLEYGEFA